MLNKHNSHLGERHRTAYTSSFPIFCFGMKSVAPSFRPQLDPHVPEFYRIFTLLDTKNDGQLDTQAFRQLLKKLGRDVKDEEIHQLMDFIRGTGRSGAVTKAKPIDFPVFLSWISRSIQLVIRTS